jgi:adenine/guanine phosphoribosyltransferase-like PRPP-binding protein
MVISGYLYPCFNNKDLRIIINSAAESCKNIVDQYFAINNIDINNDIGVVGTGLSGSLVVPSLALHLDWPFVIVRKKNDDSHSHRLAEGNCSFKHYIFIDDFVSEGYTFSRVFNSCNRLPGSPQPIGAVFYRSVGYRENNFLQRMIRCATMELDRPENIDFLRDLDKLIIKKFDVTYDSDSFYGEVRSRGYAEYFDEPENDPYY